MQTRGMTEDDARSRIAAQASDEQRHAAADVWLDNNGAKDVVLDAVDDLWQQRLVPFERNVREGRRSHRPEQLHLADPDPTWPAQAHRLLERLRRAFGEVALTADHVGSTALPGLLAKDVVDLQVGVPGLAAADDPQLLDRLSAAGFPRVEGIDHDNAKDGSAWPKRMHGNADPARVTNVHVREVDSPGWRWALLFRDWLRHDARAAADYAAEKQRIAATGASTTDYAEAKEPWFDAVADRAEQWADQAGWEPQGG
jgi:dephospho-CoA kinase